MNAKRNVLICSPNIYNSYIYLPAIWGILKSQAETSDTIKSKYNWLDPVYENKSPKQLLKDVDIHDLDVLGLSCYVWNCNLNLKIAEYVKSINKGVLVVAGGPHPDWSQTQEFFSANPCVDIIVKNEGEYAFKEILEERCKPTPNYSSITGLYLNHGKFTGERPLIKEFPPSYYLSEKGTYSKIINRIKNRGGKAFVLHETDRGCMYGCVFCNWGSATMTKLRTIPSERIFAEIEWFGEMEIDAIENTNANFGLLERDLEFTKAIIESNKKHGYPKDFWYSSAKSQSNRIFAIAKALKDNSMLDFQVLALQTTDQAIMRNSNRTNLKPDRIDTFVKNCAKHHIPVKVQLIRGLPGESIETWLNSLDTCLNYRSIYSIQQFPWEILPNSPAANKEFFDKWGIETVPRFSHVPRRSANFNLDNYSQNEIVVATNSYSRSDYVYMWLASVVTQVFYSFGFTRFVMQYLNRQENLPYKKQLRLLIDSFLLSPAAGPLKLQVENCILELNDYVDPDILAKDALLERPFAEIDDYPKLLTIEERLTYWLARNLDLWYKPFSDFIMNMFPGDQKLLDLLTFQKNMIIDFDYNPEQHREFEVNFDWPEYLNPLNSFEKSHAPPKLHTKKIHVRQQGTGSRFQNKMLWNNESAADKKESMFLETITGSIYTATNRNLFSIDALEIY